MFRIFNRVVFPYDFKNTKVLLEYCLAHHDTSLSHFLVIFNELLKCSITFSNFFSEKKSDFKWLSTHKGFVKKFRVPICLYIYPKLQFSKFEKCYRNFLPPTSSSSSRLVLEGAS